MSALIHGTNYERFVKSFLTNKYKHLWLWNEIPVTILHSLKIIPESLSTCDDIGCDILAETNEGLFHFIQCKNYSTLGIDNTINICDLAGFYNFMAENNFVNGIVYYSGCISSQVIKRSKAIKYVNLPYNTCETINLTPYSYQIDAFNKLSCPGRNTLTMPCGTGKTYVSYLLSASYKNIIILSPLISTAEQLYIFYKRYYNNSSSSNISVFNCMNKNKVIDLEKQNVIISTYDSVNLILENVSKLVNKIIIIDEYHNLSQNNLDNPDDHINKLLTLPETSYLYMSATPHKKRPSYPALFGTNEYYLSWETAISNKYICDYRFYYPNPDMVNDKITELKQNSILSQLEVNKCILLNKAYYLLECIKEFRIKKVIVFLKTLAESQEFMKVINVLNVFFSNRLLVNEINCNTSKTERNKVLSRFKNKNETINILCNVHILDEGIDIPECDSVFLTHPNHNPINFIQRISRCNRLKPANSGLENLAHVLIWAKDESKVQAIDKLISEYLKVPQVASQNKYVRNSVSQMNITIQDKLNAVDSMLIIKSSYERSFKEKNTSFLTNIYENIFNFNNTKIVILFDKDNTLWLSYNDILKSLGYTDIKKLKKRLDIGPEFFSTYDMIYPQSKLNQIKLEYQKPNEKFINESGMYLLLSQSSKAGAKQLSTLLFTVLSQLLPLERV